MNRQEQDDLDLLKKYINRGMIEKAPEGFTSKSMTRILIDTQTSASATKALNKYRIPVISAAVTSALILAVILLPSDGFDPSGLAFLQKLPYLNLTLPEIRMISFSEMELPGWTLYTSLGALLLAFFDSAVAGFFHKERQ